jgi:hypothetical protein
VSVPHPFVRRSGRKDGRPQTFRARKLSLPHPCNVFFRLKG